MPTHPTSRTVARSARLFALAMAVALAATVSWFRQPRAAAPAAEAAVASPPVRPATVGEGSPRDTRARRFGEGGAAAPAQRQRTLRALLSRLPTIAESDGRPPALPAELQRVLEQVTAEDPRLAVRIVGVGAPDTLTRYALATVIARVWGATSPRDAWNWASTAGAAWNVPEQRSLHAAVWAGMAHVAPEMVVETAGAVLATAGATAEGERENFAAEAAGALVAAGADMMAQRAVAQWCGWLPDNRLLSDAIGVVTANVAARSPAAAREWLETLAPSRARDGGLAVLAATWAESAPESAMAWAGSLPRGDGRDAALRSAFTAWRRADLIGCVGWLAQNEADPACDPLIGDLVSNPKFRDENPRAAVELATAIADRATRRTALSAAVESWAAHDDRAARDYLSATRRVSDAEKAEILQAVARHSEFGHY